MAAAMAYQIPRPDDGPSGLAPTGYPRGLSINNLDFSDTRYPAIASSSMSNRRSSTVPTASPDPSSWDGASDKQRRADSNPSAVNGRPVVEEREEDEQSEAQMQLINGFVEDHRQQKYQQQQEHLQPSRLEAVIQYALPPDASRRVVERYDLDGNEDGLPSAKSDRPLLAESPQEESITASQHLPVAGPRERPVSRGPSPSNRRYSTSPTPVAGVGAGPSNRDSSYNPIVPASASPSFNPGASLGIPVPISPKPRAYAQQPTYVTPSAAPNPVNPIYMPNPPPPQEEVCVECAMRDQDMADVDVTGPGVWERESDVQYEELVRREQEEGTSEGLSSESHRSNRPRARGGKLTEPNLKIWLSMNPREPQARQQTLQLYLKTQRALLEAETLARARALQESRQLESKMRDTYSQLRRSAYDMGNRASATEDGALRILTPRTPSGTTGAGMHGHSHSREVTLLENGMIVEHVNVRKEERDERERRRREEKSERSRARKSSRGSLYSVQSLTAPVTDSGLGLKPHSPYSGSHPARPNSVMTTYDRPPSFPRAYSQASFSDVHSIGSGSPRQRFFGFRNVSSPWRSRDSLAASGIMSGSMVDMHVALQRDGYEQRVQSPIDIGSRAPSMRQDQSWPRAQTIPQIQLEDIPKKKKKGLAKIWQKVTGTKDKGELQGNQNEQVRSFDRTEDDLPLAPPPPLSYLVERGPGEHGLPGARQSTTSLTSTTSPKNAMSSPALSPGTAPSSLLPSPISSRPSNVEPEIAGEQGRSSWNDDHERVDPPADAGSKLESPRNLHCVTSEPDIRQSQLQRPSTPAGLTVPTVGPASRPQSVLMLEKSLPPLPHELSNARPPADPRPRTVYDPRLMPPGASPPIQNLAAPRAPFRDAEARRQSFGGMTTRPNIQTLPTQGVYANDFKPPGARYDEFGGSRHSLGYFQEKRIPNSHLTTPSKRRSKFGLSSLLGRKSQMYNVDGLDSQEFPIPRPSNSDIRDDVTSTSGFAHSGSRHSVNPRMSVMSRKAIEELHSIQQDDDFIAYRYPSTDQQLDLLR